MHLKNVCHPDSYHNIKAQTCLDKIKTDTLMKENKNLDKYTLQAIFWNNKQYLHIGYGAINLPSSKLNDKITQNSTIL